MISKLVLETWEVSLIIKEDDKESNYHVFTDTIEFVKYTENSSKDIISMLNYNTLETFDRLVYDNLRINGIRDVSIKMGYSIVFLLDTIVDTIMERKERPGFSLCARFITPYMEAYSYRHGEFKLTVKYIGEDDPLPNNVERI